MTSDRDRPQPDAALLAPLDSEAGPMPQLSAAEADAIAWGVVSRWAARLPGVEPADGELGPARPLPPEHAERMAQQVMRRQRARSFGPVFLRAAAVLVACSLGGLAFAAYRWLPAVLAPAGQASVQKAAKAPLARPRAQPSSPPPTAAGAEPAASEPKSEPSGKLETPEELLARANALRAQRRWAAAEHVYRKVLSAGASAEQRYVALVAAASLALQHLAKPARALALYRSALALRPSGDLSEEAEFGVAECQRALGDTTSELASLRKFSVDHPDSWLIDSVKRRLAQLDAR